MRAMPQARGAARIIKLLSLLEQMASMDDWVFLSPPTNLRKPREADYKRLNDILAFILENYQSSIGLPEVAAVAHLTPSAFCRFFKKRTRKSFVEYLNKFRVSVACKLLMESDLPVADVCFQTGFNNLANFNRQFRRVTGMTPTQFRKVNQGVM
jgi:AraC-like DNA-binding protein